MRSVYSHSLPNPTPAPPTHTQIPLYFLLLTNKSIAFNINQNKLTTILVILKKQTSFKLKPATLFLFKSLTNYQYLDKEYNYRKSGKRAFYITGIELMWHTKKYYSTKINDD